jgi:hypothetical protein
MRSHQALPFILDGQRQNGRPIRPDAAEHGGESHVSRVTPGAEAYETHRNSGARRIEDVPAVPQVHLDIGLEIGWTERWLGAVVDAGRVACRDFHRAK